MADDDLHQQRLKRHARQAKAQQSKEGDGDGKDEANVQNNPRKYNEQKLSSTAVFVPNIPSAQVLHSYTTSQRTSNTELPDIKDLSLNDDRTSSQGRPEDPSRSTAPGDTRAIPDSSSVAYGYGNIPPSKGPTSQGRPFPVPVAIASYGTAIQANYGRYGASAPAPPTYLNDPDFKPIFAPRKPAGYNVTATREVRPAQALPGGQPKPDKPSPQDDNAAYDQIDEFPFTVLQDPIHQAFVRIDQHELATRQEFLLANPQLYRGKDNNQEVENLFIRQAIEFQRRSKDYASIACCLCLTLIRLVKAQHPTNLSQVCKALLDARSRENRAFKEQLDELKTGVRQQAYKLVPSPLPRKPSGTVKNRPTLGVGPSEAGRHASRNLKETERQPTGDSDDESDDDNVVVADNGTLGQLTKDYAKAPRIRSSANPSDSHNPAIRGLNDKYRARKGKWFKPGRVFALLWHEPAGKIDALMEPRDKDKMTPNLTSAYSSAKHGSIVYTSIRRMVVIRNGHGHVWCVPIGTYGGRGLRKPGLSPEDIQAHTIIYDSFCQPEWLPAEPRRKILAEPRSNKRPIAVYMANSETLDQASRIHLGRPHSIDWYVKVMDVGTVVPEDLPVLIDYVKDELFGPAE